MDINKVALVFVCMIGLVPNEPQADEIVRRRWVRGPYYGKKHRVWRPRKHSWWYGRPKLGSNVSSLPPAAWLAPWYGPLVSSSTPPTRSIRGSFLSQLGASVASWWNEGTPLYWNKGPDSTAILPWMRTKMGFSKGFG